MMERGQNWQVFATLFVCIICITGIGWNVLLWLLPSGSLFVSQVLDVYAALACIESLEHRALDEDVQSLAWLDVLKSYKYQLSLSAVRRAYATMGKKANSLLPTSSEL